HPGRTLLIPGSGVDTGEYAFAPEPEGEPVVLFAGRLLLDKGIAEFVEAARLLRGRGVAARFVAAGDGDPESSRNVPPARLAEWRRSGIVEFRGHCSDMVSAYRQSHLVCLPSHHEGLPRVLLEAASTGRAVV